MSTRNPASERALADLVGARIGDRPAHVLIGGLGMGYTLRAMLDRLGPNARITVAELVPEVVDWNRGPLGEATGLPLDDPRVTVCVADVRDIIEAPPGEYDAILMDVDNGPEAVLFPSNRFLYSVEGVGLMLSALTAGGVFALWAADRSPPFEAVLAVIGLPSERVEMDVRGDGGLVHTLYIVTKPGAAR